MKIILLLVLIFLGQKTVFSKPSGCAEPIMEGLFILVNEPYVAHK